jgi:predicted branched-subunit amino acid permease
MLDKHSFISGVLHSYPICLAFIFMYSALGMLGHANGISLTELIAMSICIFSAPLQAFLINSPDLSILATAINTFVLNFRFFLMSSVLIPLWKKNIFTIPSLHFICGSTYMVCSAEKHKNDLWSFYLGVSLPSYITGIFATIFGYFLWDIGTNYKLFMSSLAHIVLPIHFICLALKRKKEKFTVMASLIGLIMTPLVAMIDNRFSTFAWLIIAGLMVMLEERICGKQSLQPA